METNDERPAWDLYVCRRHVHDMIDSLEKRGLCICRKRSGCGDTTLPVLFFGARDALVKLEAELKKREILETNAARYPEDNDET